MKYLYSYIFPLLLIVALTACNDNDDFAASRNDLLTFGLDTVKMDTVFSRVPASTRSFWIYNNTGSGIKCSNVRLQKGNQTGFRVNVDGIYLGETYGYQSNDISVRKGDSIRVFVELTSHSSGSLNPQQVEDNLVFTLESGVQQTVNLNAWTWDAQIMQTMRIERDTIIDNSNKSPIVMYGDIIVDSLATLTIAPGSTIYFHDNAGIKVYGRLDCKGAAENNVVLRGDRLDRMFDYLPYDNLPGRWQGVHLFESSYDNTIELTDLHGAMNGIVCDSCNIEKSTLRLVNSTLHNCQGYGLRIDNAKVEVENCQITNTLNDCLALFGGSASLLHVTLAQFYPFDSNRGAALRFSADNGRHLRMLDVRNSIITGYGDDVIMGEHVDTTLTFNYHFAYSLLRTPEVNDTIAFEKVIWEDTEDTIISGTKNFMNIDIDFLRYDFHLDSVSKAYNAANPAWLLPINRYGIRRKDDEKNMGCY